MVFFSNDISMKFQTLSRTYVGYPCDNTEIWVGIKGKKGLGICQKVNVLQCQTYILQQSPWFVVVAQVPQSVNVHTFFTYQRQITYIKQDNNIIIVSYITQYYQQNGMVSYDH